MIIKYLQEVEENKRDVLWYGGNVVRIEYKDVAFILIAYGNVIGRIYQDGEILKEFKDESNQGAFYTTVNQYPREKPSNDEELANLLIFEEPCEKFLEQVPNCIYLENSNIWSCVIEEPNGNVEDVQHEFESDDLKLCIDELMELIPSIYEDFYS